MNGLPMQREGWRTMKNYLTGEYGKGEKTKTGKEESAAVQIKIKREN